jgi:hypothetical protein
MFVRTQGIDEGLDGFCGVRARQSLDAFRATAWIAGLAFHERQLADLRLL